MDQVVKNGRKLTFEVMGLPQCEETLFTDFRNRTQAYLWRDMVTEVAKHYIERCVGEMVEVLMLG